MRDTSSPRCYSDFARDSLQHQEVIGIQDIGSDCQWHFDYSDIESELEVDKNDEEEYDIVIHDGRKSNEKMYIYKSIPLGVSKNFVALVVVFIIFSTLSIAVSLKLPRK
jgi:hypothetical protein